MTCRAETQTTAITSSLHPELSFVSHFIADEIRDFKGSNFINN